MSVLDRVQRHKTGKDNSSPETTLALEAEPDILKRLRALFTELSKFAAPDGSRHVWIMRSLMDELIEEMKETDEETLSIWFEKCGLMLEWVGTGKVPESAQSEEFFNALPELETQKEITASV